MDATATLSLPIAAAAPPFDLPGIDGKRHSLSSFADGRLLVVVFIATGCPTVRAFEDNLAEMHSTFGPSGARVVAINANNPHLSPDDSLEEMARRAAAKRFPFPYLKDEDGSVARAFGAISTPHAFVFDEDRRLRYQGRIANSRIPDRVTSRDLENAVVDLLAGRSPRVAVTVPFGCSIVW